MARAWAAVVAKGPVSLVVITVTLAYYQLVAALVPAVPDLTPDLPDAITYGIAGLAIVTMLATRWRRAVPLCLAVVVVGAVHYQVIAALVPAVPDLTPDRPESPTYGLAGVALIIMLCVGWWKPVLAALVFHGVLFAFAVGVWLASGEVGERLGKRTTPLTDGMLLTGLAAGALVALVAFSVAAMLAWLVYAGRARPLQIVAGVFVVQLAVLGILTARPPPGEVDLAAEARGHGSLDLLFVVDPHDPAGRALIAQANDADVAETLGATRRDRPSFDVALAVAKLRRSDGAAVAPPYETVLQPTTHRDDVVTAIRGIDAAPEPPAYTAYGRVFADAQRVFGAAEASGLETGVRWRPGTRRAVVFFASKPPSEREMDAAESSVAFASSLADHQSSLLVESPQIALGKPVESLSLYMVSSDAASARAASWRGWTADTGGRLIDPAAWGSEPLLHAAEDALTDTPVATANALAETYRPQLKFDSSDVRRPVDVDSVLRPRARQARIWVCDHTPGQDECDPVVSAQSLLGEHDEYIDFPDDVRRAKASGGPARMYFNIRPSPDHLHIGYWWYITVNDSPVQSTRTCLPGLTISDLTCYDHEGDWEGVTVTLASRTPNRGTSTDPYDPAAFAPDAWRVESVSYDAHADSMRWQWPDLARAGSVERRTHPVVYVAKGSHASYPLPCDTGRCKQDLAVRRGLPDGNHDGADAWAACGDECLLALPSIRRPVPLAQRVGGDIPEDPALWNAFQGRWGAAHCLPVGADLQPERRPAEPEPPAAVRRPRPPDRAEPRRESAVRQHRGAAPQRRRRS